MQGSVANVVKASIKMYQTVEGDTTLKKAAKIAKIQQAHDEATQLEMPTLQMNMPMVATIVSLGTLTALFGTVLGMIGSFQALLQLLLKQDRQADLRTRRDWLHNRCYIRF